MISIDLFDPHSFRHLQRSSRRQSLSTKEAGERPIPVAYTIWVCIYIYIYIYYSVYIYICICNMYVIIHYICFTQLYKYI